jgi:hypothetical protein
MTHINQRRDTAAAWTAANPVLQDGERGYEKDTRKAKTGDGVTPWNSLGYEVAPGVVTKADVGLSNVNNTSDNDKPLSAATAAALIAKAPIASPTFTGDPKAPTPVTTDNDTSIATTAFVKAAITAAISDPDFAAPAITAAIADAVNALRLESNPVGTIKITVVDVNPSTYIGGTWVKWGAGRVPVGVDPAQAEFNVVEEVGGSKTVALTVAQMPSHNHTTVTWGHAYGGGGSVNVSRHTPTGADNTYNMGSTAAGSGQAHNNLQPYIACFMWKRTA